MLFRQGQSLNTVNAAVGKLLYSSAISFRSDVIDMMVMFLVRLVTAVEQMYSIMLLKIFNNILAPVVVDGEVDLSVGPTRFLLSGFFRRKRKPNQFCSIHRLFRDDRQPQDH